MAKSLSAFMAQNAKKVENRKIVASTRFVGEDGKPMEWEIACIGLLVRMVSLWNGRSLALPQVKTRRSAKAV